MEAPFNVEVEYRGLTKDGTHRLKVHFLDYGMYIDGWTLRANPAGGWWFFPPARPYNGGFIQMIELAGTEFRKWLNEEAERVAKAQDAAQASSGSRPGVDEVADMPPDEILNDKEKFNQCLSDGIDQTMLETGVEPEKPQRRYHE